MGWLFFFARLTFFGGGGFEARFGVSCIDVDIFDVFAACTPFAEFVIVVDADLRTADEGRDGGLSFFCCFGDSTPEK